MDSGKYGKRSGWPGETPARAIIVNFPAIYFGRSVLPITPLVDVRSPGPGGHRRRSSRIGCRPSGDIRIAAGISSGSQSAFAADVTLCQQKVTPLR